MEEITLLDAVNAYFQRDKLQQVTETVKEKIDRLSRDIIAAYKECYGSAYLGKLVFSWEDQKKLERGEIGIYTEYSGQPILPYECNFVISQPDAQLEAMVIEWAIDEWPPKFELFTRILQYIKELNGLTLSWK